MCHKRSWSLPLTFDTESNYKPQRNATVKTKNLIRVSVAALAISTAATAQAQVPAAPTSTIWRFMGIPQGMQKIRDATINRRGNHPRLERKDPLKRIADPANLESKNPAIKAAAEIKQAEDMKAQKIKAIKFLATMGCGCYDKEGKITDALIAAMDDCTPDVRLAAIEAIETAADGNCCTKCGSTSCCSEKVTKRLSEIAYERDDTGCPLEPSAEIREAAAKALCTCCPNRATGPIEEDVPAEPLPLPQPKPITGEGETGTQGIEGEGAGTEGTGTESIEADEETKKKQDQDGDAQASASDATVEVEGSMDTDALTLFQAAQVDTPQLQAVESKPEADQAEAAQTEAAAQITENAAEPTESIAKTTEQPAPVVADQPKEESTEAKTSSVKMIGGMAIQPFTITPVTATTESEKEEKEAIQTATEAVSLSLTDKSKQTEAPRAAETPEATPATTPIALPILDPAPAAPKKVSRKPAAAKKVVATVVGIDQRTGRVVLRSGQPMRAGASVAVYHHYLTGERLIAHLLIKTVNGTQAVAQATDAMGLAKIETGDRAVCF